MIEPLEPRQLLASVGDGFADVVVATGLRSPTAMAFAPDGRIFVAEQSGALRVIKGGKLLARPFVTVPTSSAGERGLLGIAFHPAFARNKLVYVYYTATTPTIHNRVSRFTARGDRAVAGSERVILELDTLSSTNHNGGAIHFGRDNKLYVAVGENARPALSQSLDNLFGKILRINANGKIPTDNPFYNEATGPNRAIWALGLRNPFTFAFQPGTSRMFINDVGQSTYEEINVGRKGGNYGWPASEGPTSNPAHISPLHFYGRNQGIAITGGAFYTPGSTRFPKAYHGDYFFADFGGGWIRRLDVRTKTVKLVAKSIESPVDLKVGADGALYYLERAFGSNGLVGKIAYVGRG